MRSTEWQSMGRRLRWGALMAFAAAVLPGASAAAADFELHRISGVPYAVNALCGSDGLDGEVSLGVNPRTGRMVAGWVQDVQGLSNPALATLNVVTATSSNGVGWTAADAPPGVTLCDQPPGPNVVATDPSVSVGPDGRWYLGRLGFEASPVGGVPLPSGVYVTTSTTGSEWRHPPVAMSDNRHDDFDTVLADPKIAGRAYATWTNFIGDGGDPERSRILFSRTTDGGASFSKPVTLHQAPSGRVNDAARIVVLGDGALLATFAELAPQTFTSGKGPFTLYASRSTDGGHTWSAPVEVGSGTYSNVVDPQTGEVYQGYCCLPSLAAGPGDSAHLVWNTNSRSLQGAIHLASTTDGGRSWTVAPPIGRSAQTFVPTVAATRKTVAVTWYDFAGEQPAGQARPTTLWVARSEDAGASWTLDRLAGPFDIATAKPSGQANYLGDTQGLVAVRGGFQAAFTAGTPVAVKGPTDVFGAFIADLPADRSSLRLTGLRLSRKRFRAARRGHALVPRGWRRGRRVGTRVRYRLGDDAAVTFRIQRARRAKGRVVGRRCRRRTRRNARRRQCTRYRTLRGKLVHVGGRGVNRFRFSGRWRNRRLARGRYRLIARARTRAGHRSRQARARFRIVRR